MTPQQLSWLRTFRGYTEDEAELAAMAADRIEELEAKIKLLEDTNELLMAQRDESEDAVQGVIQALESTGRFDVVGRRW